ncbi:MAG: mycothiol synthase [Acidimicrobiaceae bacterium]|nr:mycothiol synthase [Acidimicrobiaceae bacterium]
MHRIEIKRQLGAADRAAVQELLDAATAADAHAALDEHAWLDLVEGGRPGFAGLVAWEDDHPHPVGYAQVSRGRESWGMEFVVDPHHRTPRNTVGIDLVTKAAKLIASEGGGHVHLWVSQPRAEHQQIASSIGLVPGRALYQMRRPLPVEPEVVGDALPLPTRAFQPGRDEAAWLQVNNRAFDWHPEQGGWDLDTIRAREKEPWFDPEGFLLLELDGRLAGFCWTKIHRETEPPMGEIYVIAADPDFAGHGLGRRLTLAGLEYLAGRGLTVGMLYVDASNTAAVKLYVDLGFVVNHIDQAFVGDIPAA